MFFVPDLLIFSGPLCECINHDITNKYDLKTHVKMSPKEKQIFMCRFFSKITNLFFIFWQSFVKLICWISRFSLGLLTYIFLPNITKNIDTCVTSK